MICDWARQQFFLGSLPARLGAWLHMKCCKECIFWQHQQIETESLLTSVADLTLSKTLERKIMESIPAAAQTVYQSRYEQVWQPRRFRLRAWHFATAGIVSVLILLAILVNSPRPVDAAEELAQIRSNMAQAPFIHYKQQSWHLQEDAWIPDDVTEEGWQTQGKQWLTQTHAGSVINYGFWPGAKEQNVWYSPKTQKLSTGAAGPVSFVWDWENMLLQKNGLKAPPNSLQVERLPDRMWHGQKVRVYQLKSSLSESESEQLFYVDDITGLTVHEEGTATVREPDEETIRYRRDSDYTAFDPAKLVDPRKLAEEQKASPAK
jgi:hypothetical protein